MPDSLPGRPIRNDSPRTREKSQACLLFVLGIGFMGTGAAIFGFAAHSIAAIGIGAGAIVAAGLLSVFFALVESRLSVDEGAASNDPVPDDQRPAWPPRTSRRSPIK